MKRESRGERLFAFHCQVNKLTPEREFRFDQARRWRIDFAWPDRKLAVEVESSVHRIKGRFARDMDKYNALQMQGWLLLRFTYKMIQTGQPILDVIAALNSSV
jgi:very-short-patch-repair endonuclease